jgi:flagellar motor switch protein FliM
MLQTERSIVEEKEKEGKIVDYDFRHPQRLSKAQLEVVQSIYEAFGEMFAASISDEVRTSVELKVAKIRQLSYGEFISSLPSPTCCVVVGMSPLKGTSLLEISNSTILTIVDRLLGGEGKETEKVDRELTTVELHISRDPINKMIDSLKRAWKEIVELEPKLEEIITETERVQIASPEEGVLNIVLGIKVGDAEGGMNHCIPFTLIESIIDRLNPQFPTTQEVEVDENIQRRLLESLGMVPSELVVELGETTITMRDVLGLQVGDVVRLGTKIDDELILKVDRQPKFKCHPGVMGTKMAIKITKIIGKE